MLTFVIQFVLFCTAASAGLSCMIRGYRTRGWVAFAVLEIGYLLFWNRNWIIGGVLMAVGAWVVIHCKSLPDRSTTGTGDNKSPIVRDPK